MFITCPTSATVIRLYDFTLRDFKYSVTIGSLSTLESSKGSVKEKALGETKAFYISDDHDHSS